MSPIGFGAFKIGRNRGIKYPQGYDLPDEPAVADLLDGVLGLGINLIDTAPAYGLSEDRIGRAIAGRRDEFVLSTKVGETFDGQRSTYDFSRQGVRDSVTRSLGRLRTDRVDLLLIHGGGEDVLARTEAVAALHALRDEGLVRAIGFSAKTVEDAREALAWADVIMVEHNLENPSHAGIIADAAAADVGVLVKKGLASGHLDHAEAVRYVLQTPGVSSLVIGSLSLEHLRADVEIAESIQPGHD